MKVRTSLAQCSKRCLYEALSAEMLERVARDVIPDYDLHARTGFPRNIPMQVQVAASRVVDDMISAGLFVHFAERLALLDSEGFMGRAYRIPGLREILKGIAAEGFIWDEETGHFMEDPRIRRTPNWGRIMPGEEHRFSLLRVDVVKNSSLVRKHGESAARVAYEDLRAILARCVERRSGRVWIWEGDGALAGFVFGHSTTCAVLSGMALLHELFIYNRMQNSLGEPLMVRAAVHTGPLRYAVEAEELYKQETAREAMETESRWTPPGCLSITPAVAPTLDRVILDRFRSSAEPKARSLVYEIRMTGP
jgi:hypothetical protein